MASLIAQAVADNLPFGAMYRYHDEFITINTVKSINQAGEIITELEKRPMTAKRFTTWIEQFMTFSAREKDPVESIGKILAEQILASDYLRASVPEIVEIMPVRLPAWGVGPKGERFLRILPAGYDPATRIYSAETVEWDSSKVYPVAAVIRSLNRALASFPWAEKAAGPMTHIRSASCFMAYMVGQFCRHLIGRQPMILIIGNQPGTGKTLLAKFALGPIYGAPNATPFPKDDASLQKLLFTKLISGAPYVLIDDLINLSSTTLNQYATSEAISDRVLGGNTEFCGTNRMQIISTGNNLTVTPDIERRSLIIDLFDACKSVDKNIQNPLTERVFSNPQWRREMLMALWSLVWHWNEQGCPSVCSSSAMPSFEGFSEVVGSIVMTAGFISPFTKRPATTDGGDVRGNALERLLVALADQIQPETPEGPHTQLTHLYTVESVMEVAGRLGLVDIICSGKNQNQSMGHQLRKLKGRQFVDSSGRAFTFGRREDAVSSQYNVVILSEPRM
ncbi:primase-helicase family protein [Akkermansia sp.]|uniref:primase-helicase family protein n=2 Tax=Akkermansia sp. TaxID=1872421 RepID=UPI002596A5E8|nr:primase-helicase family protein [uncultured Akkermansia sp.]